MTDDSTSPTPARFATLVSSLPVLLLWPWPWSGSLGSLPLPFHPLHVSQSPSLLPFPSPHHPTPARIHHHNSTITIPIVPSSPHLINTLP